MDNTAAKAAWTTQTLNAIAGDPQIVGFALFNNNVIDLHHVQIADGSQLTVTCDWQFNSSPAALAAFQAGISNPIYGSGLMPSDIKGTVRLRMEVK